LARQTGAIFYYRLSNCSISLSASCSERAAVADDDLTNERELTLDGTSSYQTLKEELESLGIFIDALPQLPEEGQDVIVQLLSEEIQQLKATVAEQDARIAELERVLKCKHDSKAINHFQ
jgi:hypothetical protein